MTIEIGRRQFISALGGVSLAWPLTARAQQRDAARHLGVLMGFVADDPEGQADAAAFVWGLGALNWKEGSNLRIDWRWGDSDPALLERYAAELVALGPDLVLAGSSSTAVGALQRRTSTIPIVFANTTDPVGQGFVASLAHPGGNITGFSNYDPLMVSKWLGMLTQLTDARSQHWTPREVRNLGGPFRAEKTQNALRGRATEGNEFLFCLY